MPRRDKARESARRPLDEEAIKARQGVPSAEMQRAFASDDERAEFSDRDADGNAAAGEGEDDADGPEAREARRERLRDFVGAGTSKAPARLPTSRDEALRTIELQNARFNFDSWGVSGPLILLARSEPEGPVGPGLAGAIHLALATGAIDIVLYRHGQVDSNSGAQFYAAYLLELGDGSSPSKKAVAAALGREEKYLERHPRAVAGPTGQESPKAGASDEIAALLERVTASDTLRVESELRSLRAEQDLIALRHTAERRLAAALSGARRFNAAIQDGVRSAIRAADSGRAMTEMSGQLERALRENERLSDEIQYLYSEVDAATAKAASSERESCQQEFEAKKMALNARIAGLEIRLWEAVKQTEEGERGGAAGAEDAAPAKLKAEVVASLLPEVSFLKGSQGRLLDFDTRAWILTFVHMVENFGDMIQRVKARNGEVCKILQARDGWWEIRLSSKGGNGQRAYVTQDITAARSKHMDDGTKWLVYVHLKKDGAEQKRVFKNLP